MNIRITTAGQHSQLSRGSEVWILSISADGVDIPLSKLHYTSDSHSWSLLQEKAHSFRNALVTTKEDGLSFETTADEVVISFLRHAWSGIVTIAEGTAERTFDLCEQSNTSSVEIYIKRNAVATKAERACKQLAAISETDIVAIAAPCWKGVFSATTEIFDHVLAIPENPSVTPAEATEQTRRSAVDIILACKAHHFVVSGGDLLFLDIIREVRKKDASKKFCLMFHGAFLALGMTLDREILMSWIRAVRSEEVDGIICVKRGMEKLCERLGARAMFHPVCYPTPVPLSNTGTAKNANRLVGIWLSRSDDPRKSCPALGYALPLVPRITLHASGLDWPMYSLLRSRGVDFAWHSPTPISQRLLRRKLSQMNLSLYLTASECCPMLPLESLAEGVPCLIGPATYYFEDEPLLHDYLVVKDIANPLLIKSMILNALDNSSHIMTLYADYANSHNNEARHALKQFILD